MISLLSILAWPSSDYPVRQLLPDRLSCTQCCLVSSECPSYCIQSHYIDVLPQGSSHDLGSGQSFTVMLSVLMYSNHFSLIFLSDHGSGNSSLDILLALLQAEGAKIEEETEVAHIPIHSQLHLH